MASLEDLQRWISERDRDRWDAFAQGSEAPDRSSVSAFEDEIGFGLPDDVVELLLHPLGGIVIEASEDLWPRPQVLDVGPLWTFMYGLRTYGLADGAPGWLHMRNAWHEFRDAAPNVSDAVPVLKLQGDSAPIVATAGGELVRVYLDGADPQPLTGGFFDVLMEELAQLEERLRRKLLLGDQP